MKISTPGTQGQSTYLRLDLLCLDRSGGRLDVSAEQSDVLRVHQIVILDEKGTERVWIGAPVPDPIVQGQRQKRAGPVSGIILLDAKGNERGEYVTSD